MSPSSSGLTIENYCCLQILHWKLSASAYTRAPHTHKIPAWWKRTEEKKESLCNQGHASHVFPVQGLYLSPSSLKRLLTTDSMQNVINNLTVNKDWDHPYITEASYK